MERNLIYPLMQCCVYHYIGRLMGIKFWFIRAVKVFLAVTALLFVIELFKQHSVQEAILFAVTWSLVSTAIFIGSRLYQSRKGIECELCNDIPKSESKQK